MGDRRSSTDLIELGQHPETCGKRSRSGRTANKNGLNLVKSPDFAKSNFLHMAADRQPAGKGFGSPRVVTIGNFQPLPAVGKRIAPLPAQLPESGHKKYVYIRLTEINLFRGTLCSVSLCMRERAPGNLACR